MQGQAREPGTTGVAMRPGPGGLPVDGWEQARQVQFLRRVGLFQGSSPDLLAQVAAVLRPLGVGAGDVVCREGEPGDRFFLIEAGTVAVVTAIGGQPRELARLGPGEFFGEMALLSGGPRTATVQAVTPAQLWTLAAGDFRQLLAREPALDAVVQRAARLRQLATQTATFEVEHRNLAALTEGRQQLRIGRSLDNDLVFNSRLVSAHHAIVEWSGDTYRLHDLGSSNGTFVNGHAVRSVELQDGAEIWVGDQRFVFDRREIQRVVEPRGIRVDATDLGVEVKGGKKLLHDITLSILPGEFVAIVGGSGAGKTTLMDALSGVRPATGGAVRYNGRDYYRDMPLYRNVLGYVPQDDIIHTSLPVRETLHYAARLRLPPDTSAEDLNAAVGEAMEELGLTAQAKTRVASLSGGQRKRSSIGVELLTRPRIFFLDEPTSGLDPATDAQMMRLMRRLADEGSTVVLTTHATKNVMLCDKIVFLARGGYLAFVGTPQRALQYFQAEAFDEIYERLANEAAPQEWARRFRASEDAAWLLSQQPQPGGAAVEAADRHGLEETGQSRGLLRQLRQFAVLTGRSARILLQNRRQVMPLFMQPVVLSLLLLALFNSGAFRLDNPNPLTPAQILFFIAFAALFFGVSYSLNEICSELPIFRRERMVNLAIVPYVFSKIAVLAPILLIVQVIMLGLLRLAGRLPSSGWDVYGRLYFTLALTALAGLALGLFASSAVPSPTIAVRIQPLLIMPQVLFSGALLAVPSMNVVGRAISNLMIVRWSFEALGNIADLNGVFTNGQQPIGQALLQTFGNTFSQDYVRNWGILVIFIVVLLALACLILRRKSAR